MELIEDVALVDIGHVLRQLVVQPLLGGLGDDGRKLVVDAVLDDAGRVDAQLRRGALRAVLG